MSKNLEQKLNQEKSDFFSRIKRKVLPYFLGATVGLTSLFGCDNDRSGWPNRPDINGLAKLENQVNHGGIKVELGINGSGPIGISVTTSSEGSYEFYDVPPASADFYFVWAQKDFYSADARAVPEILEGETTAIQDLLLKSNKIITFDWAYQPNGTTDLTTNLQTGTTILQSAAPFHNEWGSQGFIFETELITGPGLGDICFYDTRRTFPLALDHSGNGGVIDMGDVSLDSILTAPTTGYSKTASVIFNHSYTVLTMDATHYTKFKIKQISTNQIYEP